MPPAIELLEPARDRKHKSPTSAVAMRITADAILRAQVSINPLRERELNLRGASLSIAACPLSLAQYVRRI